MRSFPTSGSVVPTVLVDTLSDPVALVDTRGVVVHGNGAWVAAGGPDGDLLAWCDGRDPDLAAGLRALLGRETTSAEGRVARAIAVEGGAMVVLTASDAPYRRAFDEAGVGLLIANAVGDLRDANPAFCAMLGYTRDELLRLGVGDLTHPDDREETRARVRELFAGQAARTTFDKRYRTRDGGVVWARVTVSATRDADGRPLGAVVAVEDITEQRAAERRNASLMRVASRLGRLGGWYISLPDGTIDWSDELREMLDASPDVDPAHPDPFRYYPVEHRDGVREAVTRCADEGVPFDLEAELVTEQGRRLWVRILGEPVRVGGEIVAVQGALQDISERKAAERSLARSAARQRELAETMPFVVWFANARGDVVYANRAYWDHVGHEERPDLPEFWPTTLHPDDVPGTLEAWSRAVADGSDYGVEFRLRGADGTYRWYAVRALPVHDEDGRITEWYGTAIDIHARRLVEERASRLASQLTATLESITDGFVTVDRDLRFTYVNGEAARLFSREASSVLGAHLPQALAGPLGVALDADARTARHTGAPVGFEHPLGDDRWISGRAYPSATGVAITFRDVTETRRAREALRESEERFRLLSSATNDAIWDWDLATDALWWNEGFQRAFGYDLSDGFTIQRWASYVHPDERPRVVASLDAAVAARAAHWAEEYRFRRADGTWAHVHDRGQVICDDEGRPVRVVGGFTDITERREVELRLREQAELIEQVRDAILVRDLDGRVLFMNRCAQELYGWTLDEARGRDVRELQLRRNPDAYARAMAVLLERGAWSGELELHRRDGTRVLVDGRWTLLRDPRGAPRAVLVVHTDITERKRLEQQIFRAQRMESIGTLAGGIAHDLNNVLAPILFSIGMLKLDADDPELIRDLDTIERCATRGAEMVRHLLSFARGVEGARADVDLRGIAGEIERLVRDTFPKDVAFTSELAESLWTVSGDETQLNQVLVNLCVNARDAMPDGGSLYLGFENVVIDDMYVEMNPQVSKGPYVLVRVEDSGQGMPPDVVERVFEPFFTTKAFGRGTGLGLSTAHAIIKGHGGFIHVYSEPGRGSRFKVYLPASDTPAASKAVAERPRLPRGQGEVVLVVDDEEAIRTMVRRTLERFGYRVLLASNGAEAVAVFAGRRHEIDVVLTDMAMPIMDGPSTILALRSIDPDVVIIGSSGLDANGKVVRATNAGVAHFVAKPYTAEVMLQTLRTVIDGVG